MIAGFTSGILWACIVLYWKLFDYSQREICLDFLFVLGLSLEVSVFLRICPFDIGHITDRHATIHKRPLYSFIPYSFHSRS